MSAMTELPDLTLSNLTLLEHFHAIQMSGLDARVAILWIGLTAWLETVKLWTDLRSIREGRFFGLLGRAITRIFETAIFATVVVTIWRTGADLFGLDYTASPRWGELLAIAVALILAYRTFFRLFPTPAGRATHPEGATE